MIGKAYFTSMSELHKTEAQALLGSLRIQVRKPTEDDFEASASSPPLFQARSEVTIRAQISRLAGIRLLFVKARYDALEPSFDRR